MWGSERKFYNFDDPKFSAATGHFTQVVWKTSSKLGCAYSKCDFGTYVVCKYGPPGNWRGQYKDKVGRLINGTLDDLYVPYWLQPKNQK